MKFTKYFEATRSRPDRAKIKIEWIEFVVNNPAQEKFKMTIEFVDGQKLLKWTIDF